ncbi:hypothetical protein Scep_001969 [Stephania cephalantha]|uniref:Uncharacterized protein n=1 Tax=Stephania cephalantha TaxID=152367 RepID=A0AAP0Q4I9_9MAGN
MREKVSSRERKDATAIMKNVHFKVIRLADFGAQGVYSKNIFCLSGIKDANKLIKAIKAKKNGKEIQHISFKSTSTHYHDEKDSNVQTRTPSISMNNLSSTFL